MTSALRLLRALVPLVLLTSVAAPAQEQTQYVGRAAAGEAPQYARPDDPWIYRGTDIPVDREWLFGELPNGLRYAVRYNGVPPGQASIRVRIDAGSLHEQDGEQGFAHLVEHLIFRQSKYLGDGEAIPHFQRWGASLGNDTNAITSPTQTVYKLDLPNAAPERLEESVRLFSGMIREPLLSEANVRTEVPIVLAERRERAGAEMRIAEATRGVFYSGQRLAVRSPIGTVEALEAAGQQSVRAFHRRWYRPENAVVVIAGDADPHTLALLVERYFGDWKVPGPVTPAPDFGTPQAPAGADPANPVGETKVLVEPGQPRGLTYAVLRPWRQVTDNIEYNRGLLIDAVAESIINRRLESRARAGGSYLYAGVQSEKTARSADGTFVALAPLTDDWQAALADVRAVIADAVAEPPSQAEIDREIAEFDVVFANMVEQTRIQAGAKLADDIVNAVDIREAVAAPETILSVFREMRHRFTPEAIHEHTRAMFEGEVVRALMLSPNGDDATDMALRTAMLAPVDGNGDGRGSDETVDFADLPPVGAPADPVVREPLGVFDVEKLTFANGVRALLWPTENEPGRATVRVRFGAGWRGFEAGEGVYAELGQMALVSMGMGPIGQEQLDRLATGRKLGFDFAIEDGVFVFEGQTRASDVADQLYLFAAKLAMPRWDAAPFERAKAGSILSYDSYATTPNGILGRDLDWLLHDRDPRFATPDPATMRKASLDQFRKTWSRLLAQGPVEVSIFGDFDRESAVAALTRTFGALDTRAPMPVDVAARKTGFPAANDEPLVIRHHGGADQAAALVAWPTGGGSAGLPQSRKLDLLAQIFSNRLLDAMREKAGASYSPYVGSNWPLDVDTGGHILALAQLPPQQVPTFFAEADRIARELATEGPGADDLARVTEPMRQLLNRAQTGHSFWLSQLQGSSFDGNRLLYLRSLMSDYTNTSPLEMQALAARYFGAYGGFRVAIVPEAGAAGAAPAGR